MAEPKWVLAMGVCASSGGMFNNYAIVQGVDHVVPVDMYLPGCPPRPEMLIDAILKLHDQVQSTKLGANRLAEIEEQETTALKALPDLPDERPAPMSDEDNTARTPSTDLVAGDQEIRQRRRRPPRHVRRPAAPATPPATAVWSPRSSTPATPSVRSAAGSTRSPTPSRRRLKATDLETAIERVVVHRGEITFHVRREDLPFVAQMLRDDEDLRFEFCSGVSGVNYPDDTGRELHAVYHLLSMTHNRRIRLEVTCPDADPHIPSLVSIYPTNDWHERETWDMFGILFDGHPAMTRILMPDDWPGHPQRKDYPLGGIPVEYKGGTIPPPDQRRSYQAR